MKTTVKPYTMVVAIPGTTDLGPNASSITLIDTSGIPLYCNWVVCRPLTHDATDGSAFLLGASSIQSRDKGYVDNISNGPSSYVGKVGGFDLRSEMGVELLLQDSHAVTSVEIGHNGPLASTQQFFLTYGYRKPVNPLRAISRPDGD